MSAKADRCAILSFRSLYTLATAVPQVTVALANKMARVVWALLVKGGVYKTPATAA